MCPVDDIARVAANVLEYDIVIHAASVLSIESEQNHQKAWNVNVRGTENVARVCKELGKRLVYISTDYVFSGREGNYSEESQPAPINYYGFTKWCGEEVSKFCPNHLILRVPFRVAPWPHPVAYADAWSSCRWLPEVVPDVIAAAESPMTGILHIGGQRRTCSNMAQATGCERHAPRGTWTMFKIPEDVSLDSSKWAAWVASLPPAKDEVNV
jgi:dTDP-4-dehydrorhamnose reductase